MQNDVIFIMVFALSLVGVLLVGYFLNRKLDREYYNELAKIKQQLDDVIENATQSLKQGEKLLSRHKKEMKKLTKKKANEN